MPGVHAGSTHDIVACTAGQLKGNIRGSVQAHNLQQRPRCLTSQLSALCCCPSVYLSGDDYGPAPDLDHANPDLRAALKDWLLWLQQDIGFEGWRLDFVKG